MTQNPIGRRSLLAIPAFLTAGAAQAQSQAQSWPDRPVRVVVNYSAGGAADTACRLLQLGLSEALGQSVVIENRTGAGGTIGAIAVARAPADGYTILYEAAAHVVAPLMFRNLPIDYLTAFSYIGRATIQPYVMVANANFPGRTTQDFIAAARSRRDPVTYGTPGVGSSGHIAAEAFAQAAGIRLEHVPYRGGAEAANALAAGDIDSACITLSSAGPVVQAGRAHFLGVTGASRAASHPDIPPLADGGLPGFDFTSWSGFMGPAGMPEEAIRKFAAALQAAGSHPATMQRLAASGFESAPTGPADFAALVARDREAFGAVVRRAGMQPA